MRKSLVSSCVLSFGAIAGWVAAGASLCHAQTYPARPIRLITSPVGGGNDFAARLIAAGVSGALGQQVIVDNRPTVLIAELVAKAPPDGYTLLLTGSAHWVGPLVDKVSYDPVRDFEAITLVDRAPSVLVVHPSLPAKSVRELVGLARARPGDINVAVGGAGSSNYTAAVLFAQLAGVNMLRVPYKGNGPALTALLSGEVQVMFSSAGGVAAHLKSGRLRALGVGSAKASPLAPGLPAIAAAGVPGYLSESLHAMYAPARTPQAVVARVHAEVSRYLNSEQARGIFLKAGIEPSPSTPAELIEIMNAEVARLAAPMKAAVRQR